MPKNLQEIRHYGPVTALKFLSTGSVLVGYGPLLRLFDPTPNGLVESWRRRIFQRNKIHAISLSHDEKAVAVVGGRSFCVCDLNGIKEGRFVEKALNEWIISSEFVSCSDSHFEILLLNSHNQVLRVDIERRRKGGDVSENVSENVLEDVSEDVYCVQDTLDCSEKSILYSGTVQKCLDGRILVAAGTVMNGVLVWDLEKKQVLYNLTDHEGSIFQAKIDRSGQYLVTCSDDRSIKLYALDSGKLLATGWGHGSRIWSLSFGRISGNSSVGIFSTGEDCTARYWSYTGAPNLEQVVCFPNCHEGKHIWSGDAMENGVFVTGGADGKVRLLNLNQGIVTTEELTTTNNNGLMTLDQIEAFSPQPKECIKQFGQLSIGGFFVVTSLGNCFFHNTSSGWQKVDLGVHGADFSKAQVKTFFHANLVKLFSKNGHILSLHFQKSNKISPIISIDHFTSTKVSTEENSQNIDGDIKWVPKNNFINVLTAYSPQGAVALLVDPNPKQPFFLRSFDFDAGLTKTTELEKPDPRVFIPTYVHYDSHTNWLFVGSRHGNLAMYDLAHDKPQPQVFWKICPGDTITSISHVHSQNSEFMGLFTIRDGVYMVIRFCRGEQPQVLLENKFPRGSLEGGFFRNNEIFLYGFRSSSFFVWNETKQMEVGQAFCAGAHREWRVIPDSEAVQFSFLSKNGLNTRKISCSANLLSSGTHGREIRSIALCPSENSETLIATASEDASVKFGMVSKGGHVDYTVTMRNHVSGLQKVAFLSPYYAMSSAANEELLLWRISHHIPGSLSVTEEARIPVQEETPDLRIMDFSAIPTDDGFSIAAIYSNSQIKLFNYNGKFDLMASHVYSTCCLLNVELLQFKDSLYLVVGATDGYLTIWALAAGIFQGKTALGNPLIRQQLHQSGIKAMHTEKTSGGFKIITGGDDNSLLACSLRISQEVTLHTDSFVEKAASATITGISSFGTDHVLVTSVDQIVRVWDHSGHLACVSESYTTVADTGCCASMEERDHHLGFIGGAGLSVFLWSQ